MSSSLLVELVVMLLVIVGTSWAFGAAVEAAVGVDDDRIAPTVVAGKTISGVVGNKALRPWRRIEVEPAEPEPPEFGGARFWVFGENLESSERCLRSHQF